MKHKFNLFCFLLIGSCLVSLNSCKDKDDDKPKEAPALTQTVNRFIWEVYDSYYLWNQQIPQNIDYRYEQDPFAYFDKLKYKDDHWSALYDDADALMEGTEGVATTFGYRLTGIPFSDEKDKMYVIILFVYPDSPAAKAGLKSGDIILKINGQDITDDNANDLYKSSSVQIQLAKVEGNYLSPDKSLSLTAQKMYENPINTTKIIEKPSHKIGYLAYTDYVTGSKEDLARVFTEFKQAGVTDVVLDLRYNGGGEGTTAQYLCSILAPASAVTGKSVLIKEFYNDAYTAYLQEKNVDSKTYFDQNVPVNMDLNRLYILTSPFTASASELTLVGLKSYMNVVQIGLPTAGKCYGAGLFEGKDVHKDLKNWAMALIYSKYANNDGFTDFIKGCQPNHRVTFDLNNLYAFGDEQDPLLAKAIELITGATPADVKSAGAENEKHLELFRSSRMINPTLWNQAVLFLHEKN